MVEQANPATGTEIAASAATTATDKGGAKDGAPSASGAGGSPTDKVGTLGEGGGGEDKAGAVPATWPTNWKDIMAGGDAKILQRLNKFDSPANVAKAYLAIQTKMSAGELLRAKPSGDEADPTYQQAIKEWRGQAGVPEKPEGYLEKMPDGLVIGEEDKPMVESFIKDMHGSDVPPAIVHKAIGWYYANQEAQAEQRHETDRANRAKNEDSLRAEWGTEYRANLNGIRGLFNTHGSPETLEALFTARLADGTPLGDDPRVLKFLVNVSKEINPSGIGFSAIEGKTATESIAKEKAGIEALMKDNRSSYWTDIGMQNRYRELLELEERHERRKAG